MCSEIQLSWATQGTENSESMRRFGRSNFAPCLPISHFCTYKKKEKPALLFSPEESTSSLEQCRLEGTSGPLQSREQLRWNC